MFTGRGNYTHSIVNARLFYVLKERESYIIYKGWSYIMNYNLLSGSRIWPFSAMAALLLLVSGCGGSSGNALLEQGTEALEADQLEEAIAFLGRAEEKLPDNPSVHCNLGVAYWKDGQYELAVSSLRRAAELAGSESAPLEFLGNIFIELEGWNEALQAFELAMERDDGRTPRLLTAMSVVKLHTKDLIEARRLLSEALKQEPDYMPALYNMAVLYRDRAGNMREAEKYFRKFMDAASDPARMGPPADESYITSAEVFLGPDETMTVLEEPPPVEEVVVEPEQKPVLKIGKLTVQPREVVEKVNPVAIKELLAEAEKAIENEEFVAAKIKLSQAREMAPEDPEPLWQLAVLYDKHLDFDAKAEATYKKFKIAFPGDRRSKLIMLPNQKPKAKTPAPKAKMPIQPPKSISERKADEGKSQAQDVFNKAYEAHANDDWDEAIAGYKKALELNDKLYNAVYNMGLAYKKKGDMENAKAFFRKSTVVQPRLVKAWYMLALVHKELKEYKDSISAASHALDLDPGYDKAHYLLGLVYGMSGRPDLAKGYFTKCIECSPSGPVAARAREHLNDLP